MLRKIFFFLILLIGLCIVSAAYFAQQAIEQPLAKQQRIDVLYGDSITRFANNLKDQGVFDHPRLVILASRYYQLEKIKAGEYQLNADMSVLDLLRKLNRGEVIEYAVTLIEGRTLQQALANVWQAEGLVASLKDADQATLLKAMGASEEFSHAEGLVAADTFHYIKGSKDRDVLRAAHQQLMAHLNDAWQEAQGKNLPYKSAYELLIMASIIERETSVGSERSQIAGVFVQRLKKGMRLQTDPTVIYGMGENYQGKITYKDLRTPTPYNTYTISGLPPTPIALVSKASLAAAANPLLNDKLYFVAKGDGYHQFSATLAEHQKAVNLYQKQRRADYRSTPDKTQ